MAFVSEAVPNSGPVELAEEHRNLVAWIKASRIGAIEYLNQRMVDLDLAAALYYIQGLGMGYGQQFALVRGDSIYLVSVYRCTEKAAAGPAAGCVHEVSLPESAPMSRSSIQSLLTDALHAYYEAHPNMMHVAFSSGAGAATFDWSGVRWVVRPKKYSLLYWRTRSARAWREFRARLWPRIWGPVTSPLAAALSLVACAWAGGDWTTAFAGVWLSLRLLRYKTDWRLSAWMLGLLKYRNPMGHLRVLSRLLSPEPLAALTVRVESIEGEPMMRVVRVVNRSWLPVPHVSVGSHSLAQLLAPGLIELLRRQGQQGAIQTKELERLFPSMVKKWLWPRQSFASRHHLLADFRLSKQPRQIEALVDISRFASGETRSGPTSFLLDVESHGS